MVCANYRHQWESAGDQSNCKEGFGAVLHTSLQPISPSSCQRWLANQLGHSRPVVAGGAGLCDLSSSL